MRPRMAVLLACALGLALSCAPAPQAPAGQGQATDTTARRPTTALEIAAYQGPDRQQLLEAGARQEGKLTWYTSLTGATVKNLIDGFEGKYPYLKVDLYRGNTSDVMSRISEELQARRYNFDTLEVTALPLLALRDTKALAPYFTPLAGRFAEDVRELAPDGLQYWIYDRDTYVGFGYNTNAIPESTVPRTYQDLLNPALRGKMALAGSDTGARLLGNMLVHQGEAFLQEFARQDVAVQMVSGQAVLDMVVAGELPASPTVFRSHVTVAMAKGAPVRWVPLNPVTTNSGGTAVSANAPHPHAAMLWVDFILSEDGQQALEDGGLSSPAIDPGFQRWYPEKGLTPAEAERKNQQWEDLLKQRFVRR